MKEIVLKTNIMCEGCIANVTKTLDSLVGKGNWKVDIKLPTKPLRVFTDTILISTIIDVLSKLNYKAELV